LSDTEESSESDFRDEEAGVLSPASGDDNDGDGSVHVINTDFFMEDMDNYSELRKVFTGMFGPENRVQGVTNVVGIFELFFDKDLVQAIADESNSCAQQLKDSRGTIYRSGPD
jgi:hypothetical protein